jgi:CcmD family protein
MKQLIISVFVLLCLMQAHAQGNQPTGLRADGKIYVVIAVCVTILLGLFLYVIRLDRRINKLEKGKQ